MDLTINPIDLLTDEQRDQLQEAVFQQILEAIKGISTDDLSKAMTNNLVDQLRDQIDCMEFIDTDRFHKVASKHFTDILVKAVKK